MTVLRGMVCLAGDAGIVGSFSSELQSHLFPLLVTEHTYN